MKKSITLLLLIISSFVNSQEKPFTTQEIAVNSLLNGTLFLPNNATKDTKLVILIAGSGPTDRNGNQSNMTTNCSKYLAESLATNKIATFTYDKRIFAQYKSGTLDEKTLRFDDLINDAKDVLNYFKSQNKYSKILFAGHSEGSLIGMVAANGNADGFISLEGVGKVAYLLISEQIAKQAPSISEECNKNLDLLKEGKTFENTNPALEFLFRQSLQPYMISWFKYDPQVEIKKLTIPIIIINGTKDIQTTEVEAYLLKEANPKAEIKIIQNMNHIFKEINVDADNLKSYNNPDLPIMPLLTTEIVEFVNKN